LLCGAARAHVSRPHTRATVAPHTNHSPTTPTCQSGAARKSNTDRRYVQRGSSRGRVSRKGSSPGTGRTQREVPWHHRRSVPTRAPHPPSAHPPARRRRSSSDDTRSPRDIRASYIIYATPRLISWGDRHRRLRAGRHHWDPTAQCASRRPTTTPAQRGGASQPLDGDKQQRQRTMGRSSKGCSCRRSSMVWGSLSTSEEPTCGYGWHRHTIAHTAAHV
jgi:hypothetical protein